MLETSARLLRLLAMLKSRRSWPGPELSQRLEVTDRTLRRDVERLRSIGYPVLSASGTDGGYSLGAGASLPPLLFDDDECIAVVVALQTAAGNSVAGLETASLRALAKLEPVLPSRLRGRFKSLRSSIVPMADTGPAIGMRAVAILASACSDNREVRFRYRDHQDNESDVVIEPHRIVHMERRWYLVGRDKGGQDWRTFRVDGIEPPISFEGLFTPRSMPSDDIATHVSNAVASSYGITARILLHAPIDTVRSRIPGSSGRFEAIDDRSCRLHTSGTTLGVIAAWLAVFCVDFEIEDPPELAQHVEVVALRLARAAATSGVVRGFPVDTSRRSSRRHRSERRRR
jgi:predicted DNA-binding transcriptional regulator YafY